MISSRLIERYGELKRQAPDFGLLMQVGAFLKVPTSSQFDGGECVQVQDPVQLLPIDLSTHHQAVAATRPGASGVA